jgi:phage-related protein (TIGR01555 family)
MTTRKASQYKGLTKKRADSFSDGVLGSSSLTGSGGGFRNNLTGLGTFNRDKVLSGGYSQPLRIPDPELSALFNGNDLAHRIAALSPKEVFRRGYMLLVTDPAGAAVGGQPVQSELGKSLTKYGTDRFLDPKFKEAGTFSRLYGGGLLLVGADDGLNTALPLDEANIRSIKYLNYIDRRFIFARSYYMNPFEANFGEVETYQITSTFGAQSYDVVHESRVIRFDGAPVDILMRRQLAGWTLSVLQAPYDVLRMFDSSFQAVANLMTDMAQAVFKMKGLIEQITSGRVDEIQTRMLMVDMMRSSARMMLLDADGEDFERKQTPMSSVPEALDRMMIRMASAADMPVTVLFKQSPAGLNATGEADFRSFYDGIAGDQKSYWGPKLLRVYNLMCLAKDGPTGGKPPPGELEFFWYKLWEPNEKELANLQLFQAQADDLYINNGTLTPSECALSRWRGGQLSLQTQIDVTAREAMMTKELATLKGQPHLADPAKPPPPAAGPPKAK